MKQLVLIISVLVFLSSCKESEKEVLTLQNEEVLQNTFVGLISPSLNNLKIATESFQEEVSRVESPYSVDQVEVFKTKWKDVKLAWEAVEIYNIGVVNDSYLKLNIDYWPINEVLLESKIADNLEHNKVYIQGLNAGARGLVAIEYLLNKEGTESLINGEEKRIAFFRLLVNDVMFQLLEFNRLWDGYHPVFIVATGDAVTDSKSILVNGIINELELILNNEIGNPLGLKGTGRINSHFLESPYDQYSKEVLMASLKSIHEAFKLNKGLGELITNPELRIEFVVQLEKIIALLQNQPSSITSLLSQGQTDFYQVVYDETKIALRILKADIVNDLKVTLTVGDSDGD